MNKELLDMLKDIANVMPYDDGGIGLTAENVEQIKALIAKAESR